MSVFREGIVSHLKASSKIAIPSKYGPPNDLNSTETDRSETGLPSYCYAGICSNAGGEIRKIGSDARLEMDPKPSVAS